MSTSTVLKISRAERRRIKLRAGIFGPSGSGKTFTAMRLAHALLEATESYGRSGNRIVIISSESGATEKYLGLAPDGWPWEFDILPLPEFSPSTYTEALLMTAAEKYDVAIIDSWSHAWEGIGGVLEMVNNSDDRNRFAAWKNPSALHTRMVLAALHIPMHLIATMRSKMEYVQEEVNGRKVVRKVGMQPIQRPGMEYEFDVTFDIDEDHIIKVGKTRCPEMDAKMMIKPGVNFFIPLAKWLNEGSSVPPDYYAATEADLAKLERAMRIEHPASREELMARAYGVQAGPQAGGDGATAGPTGATVDQATAAVSPARANGGAANGQSQAAAATAGMAESINAPQAAYIREKFKLAFNSPAEFAAMLVQHGCDPQSPKLDQLSFENAGKVIAVINERIAAKQSAATAQPAAANEPPSSEPAAEEKPKRGRKKKTDESPAPTAASSAEQTASEPGAGEPATGEPSAASQHPPESPQYAMLAEHSRRFGAEREAMLAENGGKATEAQRKRLLETYIHAYGKEGAPAALKPFLETYGVAAAKDMTVDQINTAIESGLRALFAVSQHTAPKN